MATPLHLSAERAVPVAYDEAMARVLPMPLDSIFDRRYAALPLIREITGQDGAWATVGQTRTIHLADGGTMHETLTEVDGPARFGYRIDQVTGPMKLLADHVDGLWSFAPAGTGTRITWEWTVHPAGTLGGLAMPLFGVMWRGYARLAFERLEKNLVG